MTPYHVKNSVGFFLAHKAFDDLAPHDFDLRLWISKQLGVDQGSRKSLWNLLNLCLFLDPEFQIMFLKGLLLCLC